MLYWENPDAAEMQICPALRRGLKLHSFVHYPEGSPNKGCHPVDSYFIVHCKVTLAKYKPKYTLMALSSPIFYFRFRSDSVNATNSHAP